MNRKSWSSVKSSGNARFTAFSALDREALVADWQKEFGVSPPANTSRQLMLLALSYRHQEQKAGGLKTSARRFLEQSVNGKQKILQPASAKPGTRLLREWNGVTYEVTVLKDGVSFQGQKYRSLTEVARVITGAHWSGPLFFGLKKKSKKGEAA